MNKLIKHPHAVCLKEGPGDAVETTDVEGRELLERSWGQVDAAGRASGARVRDRDGDGAAIGARDDHLATAHRVSGGERGLVSIIANVRGEDGHTRSGSHQHRGS